MKIYLVGGAVRDCLLGRVPKEKDYVVVGATVRDMLNLGFRQVGKEFPVFLHPETQEEYALARMERKTAPGYKGFAFDTSPEVTLEEDLIRRDLTINAMAMTESGELIDPYHGKQDLQNLTLRHVSPAFAEDPVRILRIGRFLARYFHLGFRVAPETIDLMRQMVEAGEVNALVAERVWKELERALGEKNPEKFFEVLAECGALPILFPALDLKNKGFASLITAASHHESPIILFACLLHDVEHPKKQISELCERYRVPNAYRALAKLVALHHQDALNAKALAADKLLDLLSALDAFRRKERFDQFLQACLRIAEIHQRSFQPEWLKACVDTLEKQLAGEIQAFVKAGLDGEMIAKRLKERRLELIEMFIRQTNP